MSILLADGFGYVGDGTKYPGSTDFHGDNWVSTNNQFRIVDNGDGRKYCAGDNFEYRLLSGSWSDKSDITVAFRLYRTLAVYRIPVWLRRAGSAAGYIVVDQFGCVCYSLSNGGRTYVLSDPLPLNCWTHIEVRVVLDNTSGELYCWVEGVLSYSNTGIDTAASIALCDSVAFWGYLGPNSYCPYNWRTTDIIVHDNSSPVGPIGVFYKPADSDGSDQDFTPSSGSDHFAMVDEIGPDEDSTYNESDGTSGHRDDFANDGSVDLIDVAFVQGLIRAKLDGTGSGDMYVGIEEGTSENQSSAKSLTDAYLTYVHNVENNPSTTSPWDVTEAETALVSVEIV